MVKFSNYIFCHFEFGISFAPLLLGIQQSRKKHKNRASCRFVSSALTHSWVSYSNETYTTLANSAYMWFLAHAISAVGTRSLQPERTQRTAANSRRAALRAQPLTRTYCCWRCVCNVRVSNLDTLLIECRKSDIRRGELRMSNMRHSTDGWSKVENPTSEEARFGCRIFGIRRTADRIEKSDPTNKANRIEFAKLDPIECTRLIQIL